MNPKAINIEKTIDQRIVDLRKANLRHLSSIEHRLEYVDTIANVEYINDAKADDANSAWYSLDSIEKPIVWIMSSCAHEQDLSLFAEMDLKKVKAVVVLGANQGAVEDVFRGKVRTIARAQDVLQALKMATTFAVSGDVVMYSPAFADMENYAHYKERGQQFRKAVREMQLNY